MVLEKHSNKGVIVALIVATVIGAIFVGFFIGKSTARTNYDKQLEAAKSSYQKGLENAYLKGCQYPLQQALPTYQMFEQFKDEYAAAFSQCQTQSQTIDLTAN